MRKWFAWPMLIATATATAADLVIKQGADLVGRPVVPAVISIDPATLPVPHPWRPGDPVREIPIQIVKDYAAPVREPRPSELDPLFAEQSAARGGALNGGGISHLLVNVNGSGFGGTSPADTIGDVGHDHYVQLINHNQGTQVRIVDKATGSLLQFFILDALAAGSGTNCASGNGDPIVIFDESVDNGPGEPPGRWVLTEFVRMGINSVCMYVSQTSDPTTGNWFLYEFDAVTGQIPDYPKYGVWPDAYYLGVNERINTASGPLQYALDRERMLIGQPARAPQVFEAPTLAGFLFQHVMPVDWDGAEPPPPGSPGLFIRHRDTELHGPSGMPQQDILELFEFSVDFNNPANSSFTGPINVPIAEFDSEFCNLIFSGCLEQPGSATRLFALLQPIMWRAQYRNFGSHQSIVANMVTDVTGNDLGGVRWFELRSFGAGYEVFQEGTLSAPGTVDGTDGVNRWMASVAQDQAGNIAAGYNAAGPGTASPADDVFPGMRYSGRLQSDPPGVMPQGEFNVIDGLFPNATTRYGDYSSLSIDPGDGCTFWYTAQYNPLANMNWATRIAAFRFDDCGDPGFILAAQNLQQQVCAPGDLTPVPINVGSVFGFSNPVTLSLSDAPAGVSANFSPNPVLPGNQSMANIAIGGTTPPDTHLIDITGTASSADDRDITLSVDVFDQIPAPAALVLPANGSSLISTLPVLDWNPTAQIGEYIIEIDDDPNFASIDYTATTSETTHAVLMPLDNDQLYFWRVRSGNACGASDSPIFSFTTRPAPGQCSAHATPGLLFFDNMENGDNGWIHSGINDTWQLSSLETASGSFAWFAEDLDIVSDQRLVSPAVDLPVGVLPIELVYQNSQTIEDDPINNACWDAGILEISIDDGQNWMQLSEPRLLTEPYDGVVNTAAGGPNPLSGLPGWCADPQDFTESIIDLSDFQGQTVRLRFRLGTDGSFGRIDDGWFIDDVLVQACLGSENILTDGFEQ